MKYKNYFSMSASDFFHANKSIIDDEILRRVDELADDFYKMGGNLKKIIIDDKEEYYDEIDEHDINIFFDEQMDDAIEIIGDDEKQIKSLQNIFDKIEKKMLSYAEQINEMGEILNNAMSELESWGFENE